jgi:propionaldehyde dehydrogenase
MMTTTVDESTLAKLVAGVVAEVAKQATAGQLAPAGFGPADGIFDTMDQAVEAAAKAWREYMKCTMADRARFVAAIRATSIDADNLEYMSRASIAETGMGNLPDRIAKNRLAATLTPGTEDLITEAWSGDDGLTTIELSPFGVIGAITPTTNPTETLINNTIGMLAAGNTVVFSPHPRATNVSHWVIAAFNHALAEAGAPANLVVTVKEPSLENTEALMQHKLVNLLVATGGPGIVRAVMSSGKKAIGAGAGNPPAVVDQTADLKKAAKDIVNGCSFDNNLPCIAEKEVIAVDSIVDLLRFYMITYGAYEIRDRETLDRLQTLVMDGKAPKTDWVGKSATDILAGIGIEAPEGTKVIIAETEFEHPFVQSELMMPVLPIVRVKDVDEAIDKAIQVEHGFRHTAIMHSTNVTSLSKMGKLIQTTIFIKNGPSYAGIGIGGEGYTTFTIAGPTGEGLTSAKTFCRRRRCALVGGLSVR